MLISALLLASNAHAVVPQCTELWSAYVKEHKLDSLYQVAGSANFPDGGGAVLWVNEVEGISLAIISPELNKELEPNLVPKPVLKECKFKGKDFLFGVQKIVVIPGKEI